MNTLKKPEDNTHLEVLPTLYTLVGKSLVHIDRTQPHAPMVVSNVTFV